MCIRDRFDVSRAYIFENTEDNRFCCNTFEWCNEGISSQIEHLRQVSYQEDLGGTYLHHFNEDGVFYCQDVKKLPPEHYAILAPKGVKSMLQCAIRDNGQFRGYVGFDECCRGAEIATRSRAVKGRRKTASNS